MKSLLALCLWLVSLCAVAQDDQPLVLPDELPDLLEQRWFSVEFILFERLAVLQSNTDETLLRSHTRTWPHNITQLEPLNTPKYEPVAPQPEALLDPDTISEPGTQVTDASSLVDGPAGPAIPADGPINHAIDPEQLIWLDDTTLDLTSLYAMLQVTEPQCLGYPLWDFPDPVSPLLIPPSPAEHAAAALLQSVDAQLAELSEAPGADDASASAEGSLSQSAADLDAAATAETSPDQTPSSEDQPGLDDFLIDPALPDISLAPPPDPAREAYQQLLQAVSEFEDDLHQAHLQPDENLTMLDARKAINRRNELRPLLHQRWIQAVPERGAPLPIVFATDTTAESGATVTGQPKIQGHMALTVGRYLHLAVKLWYHADTLGMTPRLLPTSGPASEVGSLHDDRVYFEMDESRRMRSEELHYLDHPKLGLVVRIDPLVIPEPLQQQYEQTLQLIEEATQQGFN